MVLQRKGTHKSTQKSTIITAKRERSVLALHINMRGMTRVYLANYRTSKSKTTKLYIVP